MKPCLPHLGWTIALLLAVSGYFPAYGQVSYEKADSIAAAFEEPYENAGDLALKLTQGLSSEEEKARVLFMWIAHHIRYDVGEISNPSPKPHISAPTREALQKEMQEWERKKVEKTLKYRKGICGDYSLLYKALCDAAGLEAAFIGGYSREFYRSGGDGLGNTHAWNAVKIDGKWHLLDATWGAGYLDPGGTKFHRRISPGFFFTDPVMFAQNHFPDDDQWQLLETPLSRKEFLDQPLIHYGQTEYRILDFAPRAEASQGKNQKEVWLVFETVPKELMVTNPKGNPLKFERTDLGNKVVLSFPGGASGRIAIFGGRSLRSRMDWMARYDL